MADPVVNIANAVETTRSRRGERAYLFSPDWCRKETWWNDAIQAAQHVDTGDAVETAFQLPHGENGTADTRILNLNNGLISQEMFLAPSGGIPSDFLVKVTVDAEDKVERRDYEDTGGDFTVDYVTGVVTFLAAPADQAAITVDYYYVPADAQGTWLIGPQANKLLVVDFVEIQVSKDVVMNDTLVQQQFKGASPQYPGGINLEYRRFGTILDFTFGAHPEYPPLGGADRGTQQPTIHLRFDYLTGEVLRSSETDYIKVWLKYGQEFGGERCAITAYATQDDE